ncbi:MAG: hypothetical protein KME15_08335 [Drouetiella hepatica Uher 2000/2452]|jgi:hypothetical protein|uniref:Uncharacterized protein n=1 Tax=Drouetiella hepatica Uher 2000/2452 TaxID=904376 RepID=A0A951Q9G0_9CYAN|nr:hypothetical protein [Drouetiella hepatica Uher 2000/2452]
MTALSGTTRRRLKKLRQVPSIWEGDCRALASGLGGLGSGMASGLMSGMAASIESQFSDRGNCIIWMDGTEGLVRAMDMAPSDVGQEAIVRTLLQAMEFPHGSAMPARPQRIIVCDRELQFFLRGVLQDLDIVVEYAPELPLIDEFFDGLQGMLQTRPPELPDEYIQPMAEITRQIWRDAPWETLDEEKIISIELNYSDVGTLYVSILGMLGVEYGLLMYRSLDSLKKFRQQVLLAGEEAEDLESAFLEQDCLFVTFDQNEEDWEEDDRPSEFANFFAETGVYPAFGNLHPLEGMRPVLYEEEARVALVALDALHRFCRQHLSKLAEDFPSIQSRYRIPDPKEPTQKISVKVCTLPAIAEELFEMSAASDTADGWEVDASPILRSDLIPEDSFYSLGAMPWDTLDVLRTNVKFHQSLEVTFSKGGDGFPVILIQTSRPKAIALIDALKASGGLKAICFNPGEDPISGDRYDLGILQTENGEMHLFGEFLEADPVHIQARKKWDQRCKKVKGYCGLVIAKGFTGASKGNPEFADMLALFEARSVSSEDLGLGSLQLMPYFE